MTGASRDTAQLTAEYQPTMRFPRSALRSHLVVISILLVGTGRLNAQAADCRLDRFAEPVRAARFEHCPWRRCRAWTSVLFPPAYPVSFRLRRLLGHAMTSPLPTDRG